MAEQNEKSIEIRPMAVTDLEAVIKLWVESPGVELNPVDDSIESLARFIEANPSLSLVAEKDGDIVGAVLCGCDMRRAYLYHMAVSSSCRRLGLGRKLAELALESFRKLGIRICFLFVLNDNYVAKDFWVSCGFRLREDFGMMTCRLVD